MTLRDLDGRETGLGFGLDYSCRCGFGVRLAADYVYQVQYSAAGAIRPALR